jgi:Ca2+-binding EF-hand superfamily protein
MNSNSFAWRLITNNEALYSLRKTELDESHLIQLKGIFNHYDADRDGLLSVDELTEALKALGFSSRERFLKKFNANSTQLKIQGLHSMNFKVDLKTFISVINREVNSLQKIEEELGALFSFIDVNETGFLSRKEIRHLLVEVETPCKMDQQQFQRFVKGLTFTTDTDSISIGELKRVILFLY